MPTPAVIKSFDVTEYPALCFTPGSEAAMVNKFSLQSPEKRLSDGVVIAAAGSAHALQTTGTFEQGLESFAAILRATV